MYCAGAAQPDMGPTSILPQYHHVDNVSSVDAKKAVEKEAPLVCPAGTVALIDFDCWHRGSANTSDKVRYMCKFHYCRARAPSGPPSWDHKDAAWRIDPATVPAPQHSVSLSLCLSVSLSSSQLKGCFMTNPKLDFLND